MADSLKNVEEIVKKHKKRHFGKKWLVVLFLLIIIVTAGSLYSFGVFDPLIKKFEPVSIDVINKKIKEGDKKTANDLAKNLVDKNDTVENRRVLVLTEQLDEDYAAVIATYEPILNDKKLDHQDYQNIGDAYYHTDKKTEAAKYYRLAADNWPSDDPSYDLETTYLYRLADVLEGKVTDA